MAPGLLGAFAVGFAVLLSQVAIFTYVTFHLAAPPFHLGPAALGWVFTIYLVGGRSRRWPGTSRHDRRGAGALARSRERPR